MELGNLFFGNSRGAYEVDRIFQERFCKMLDKLGYDDYGVRIRYSPKSPFVVRPYYWGDEPEEASKPNFECPDLGLTLKWYKYPLRDSYCNIPFTEEIMERLEEIAYW